MYVFPVSCIPTHTNACAGVEHMASGYYLYGCIGSIRILSNNHKEMSTFLNAVFENMTLKQLFE